jgi:SSS family transporter
MRFFVDAVTARRPQLLRLGFLPILAFAFCAVPLARADTDAAALVDLVPAPWTAAGEARSGAFVGVSGGAVLRGGGRDPATAAWLHSLAILPARPGAGWTLQPMPNAPAWAATAQDQDALIVIGGLTTSGATAAVVRLSWGEAGLVQTALPDLPVPAAGAGAAVIGRSLYVVGGLRAIDAPTAESTLWVLNLADPSVGWTGLEPLPTQGKFLPIVTAQYDMLQVFGGRTGKGPGNFEASAEVWLYRPVPLEGTSQRGWQKRTDMPLALAAGAAVPSGQAHTFIVGGDPAARRADPFEVRAPDAPTPVLLFHALTDAWTKTGRELAVAPAHSVRGTDGVTRFAGSAAPDGFIGLKPIRRTRDLALIDYAMITGYFVLLAGIGWYFSRHQETSAEFSLGSRSVQWWAAGISLFATGASAISFMAVPALAFATNLVWVFPVIVNIAGFFVQAYVIFPMLRRLQLTSTYEYLEQRFNIPLRLIASLQQILFLTFGRAAVVLVLPAIAIATTTGLNVYVSVVVMGILTTIYTTLGGFKAVIWTEVFQGALKFMAPIAIIVVCIVALPGGVGEFIETGLKYDKFDFALLTWDATVPALWIMLLNNFLQFTVQLAGDQPMIQRVFSAPAHEVRRVAAMNVTCAVLIGIVVNVMGIAIFAYFHRHPAQLDAGTQNDQIVPLFATQALPMGLAGIVIAAIFASAMATVASNMNSVATIFTEDFYARLRPRASDGDRLRMLKAASYAVGLFGTASALLLAGLNIKSMMATWNVIMSLLGGGIVGVYSLGMLTTRANGTGAVCGALLSVAVMIFVRFFTPLHWALYMPCAIGVCMVFGYIISLVVPGDGRSLTGLTIFTPRQEPTSQAGERS